MFYTTLKISTSLTDLKLQILKKIISSLMITCLFTSCGDDNNDRVGISEITYSEQFYKGDQRGFALHHGEKFTGTMVSLYFGDKDNKDKTLGFFAQELSFYKDGLLYRYEVHSTRDTLLQDFKMKNGDVYKISELLSQKVDSDSLIYFNKNGRVSDKCAVIWKDGKYFKNGIFQRFDDDGKLFEEILYDMDVEKLSKTFHDNGKLKLEISYDNERNRTRKDFDENGKEIKEYWE